MNASSHASASPVRTVLAFSGAFLPGFKAGGPIKSLVAVLDTLPPSVSVTLVTADRDLGDKKPYPNLSGKTVRRGRHQVLYINPHNPRHWMLVLRRARLQPPDLVYLNSFFSPAFSLVPQVLQLLGALGCRRVLLAPRGEFSPGALGLKHTKKRVFLTIWPPLLRRLDPLWNASAENEVREIQRVIPWARIIAQPNTQGEEPRREALSCERQPRFVFVSRISPKKNLALILEALAAVSPDVTFDIFGPVEDARYWNECARLMERLPRHIHAEYRGTLEPDAVSDVFSRYDAFLFPTLGENFGHVIAESLSAGCPVMCTPTTPWTDVFLKGGGTVVDSLEASAWASAVERHALLSVSEREAKKQTALRAYTEWHTRAPSRLALEVALDQI